MWQSVSICHKAHVQFLCIVLVQGVGSERTGRSVSCYIYWKNADFSFSNFRTYSTLTLSPVTLR